MNDLKEFFNQVWLEKEPADRLILIIPAFIFCFFVGAISVILFKAVLAFIAATTMTKFIISGLVGFVVSYVVLCWVIPTR